MPAYVAGGPVRQISVDFIPPSQGVRILGEHFTVKKLKRHIFRPVLLKGLKQYTKNMQSFFKLKMPLKN
jgi:hypothetical protein